MDRRPPPDWSVVARRSDVERLERTVALQAAAIRELVAAERHRKLHEAFLGVRRAMYVWVLGFAAVGAWVLLGRG